MSKYREGSLEAPVRHPLNWQDEDFYNEQSLNQELKEFLIFVMGVDVV